MSSDNLPLQDVLKRLGVSLFWDVLSFCDYKTILAAEAVSTAWRDAIREHESLLWRQMCRNVGVDKESEHRGDEGDAWRTVLRSWTALDRNWRNGWNKEGWITGAENAVWRFKMDPEQNTMISSSLIGGLHVIDPSTNTPLFTIQGVRAYAHVEYADGFVIFDVGEDDLILQVYRTQGAIDRSQTPTPEPTSRPTLATTSTSPTIDFNGRTFVGTLPRGHLLYYRSIRPPTRCIAFKARSEMRAGKREATLATAGREAVYLWNLDDPKKVETILFKPADQVRVQYVDFDDQYVFLCSPIHLYIYSRTTRSCVASLPPDPLDIFSCASLAFVFDTIDDLYCQPDVPPDPSLSRIAFDGLPKGQAVLHAVGPGDQEWKTTMTHGTQGGMTRARGSDEVAMDFTACHPAGSDLICTSRIGVVLILRDYAAILSLQSAEERRKLLAQNTIWIGLGSSVNLLSTYDTRVAVATDTLLIYFDTLELPSMPFHNENSLTLKIHAPLTTHPRAMSSSSCLQLDRSNIYINYWAFAEVHAGGVHDPRSGQLLSLPERALEGMGVCVKAFNFGS